MLKYIYILILSFSCNYAYSYEKVLVGKNATSILIGNAMYYIEDKAGNLTFEDVQHSDKFLPSTKDILNFQVSESTFWLKFTAFNKENDQQNYIEVIQPLLSEVSLYYPGKNNSYEVEVAGQDYRFHERRYTQTPNFLFDLNLLPGEEKTYYLKIKGNTQVFVPIQIISESALNAAISSRTLWFGIYCGIIIVMVLYNIFIYLTIRDKSYLYYVLHTLFVGLTQASLLGFTYKYFWPDSPWFANYSNFLFTCMVSIVGIQFLIEFLRLKSNSRRLFKILKGTQAIYVVFLLTSLAGYYSSTFGLLLKIQPAIAIFILGISIHLYREGYSEAKYYLIGWSALMVGIIIYVAKDFGLLPYNNFTIYSLLFGSAAEITLLSFALAYKINIYKLDKERSQEEALAALTENARIVREQNVMLENMVGERTQEIRIVNEDLNKVLRDLKDAETHLVESEKMAALGQLTAGIAHEINNPINFVTSNITPLKRDIGGLLEMIETFETVALSDRPHLVKQKEIADCKENFDYDYLKIEIDHLLKGINEGANRTAEIVKGLRIFSRVDEEDLKKADINEGLDSTMVLVNNLLVNKIQVVKNYGALPLIECYPGKLNQVFLNVISNAIHAMNKQFDKDCAGVLTISTSSTDSSVLVKVRDNGTGMDETTKKKIFEPFFTTKGVGEGTGLGMSIAYKIIQKHNGVINVNTAPGKGTEFTIDLPIFHQVNAN